MSRRLGLLGALSIVALSGCEYFGGDRSQRGLNDGNPPTEVRVTGVVQASGPVNTASIRVFKVENGLKGERLAEGPTAEDGRFIVGFADNAYRGPVLVEASGGTFVDQSTGQTRTLQTDLRLAIPDTNSLRDGVVSPLSTIAVEAAERSTGGFTSTSIQAAINQVNALFGGTLDLGAFDQLPDDPNFPELREQALKVSDPADTTSTVTPSAANQELTLAIAGVSQLATDLGLDYDVLVEALRADVRDGFLDGRDETGASTTPDDAVSVRLARAIKAVQGNTNNARALSVAQASLDTLALSSGNVAGAVLPGLDLRAPRISGRSPASNESNVAVNSKVFLRFNEDVAPATVTGASVALDVAGAPVAGTVSYDVASRAAVFTPAAPLAANTTFSLTASTAITDLAGNPLAPFTSLFTTGAATTSGQPTLVSLDPSQGAVDILPTDALIATFDRALDITTLFANIQLTDNGTVVAQRLNYSLGSLTFTVTPAFALSSASTHTLLISGNLSDTTQNTIAADINRSFTPVAAGQPDGVAPRVAVVAPTNGASTASVDQLVSVTFSEAMDPGSVLAAAQLFDGAVLVPTTNRFFSSENTVTLSPDSALVAGRTYTLRIDPTARDVATNTLATAFTSSFTVGDQALSFLTTTLPTGAVGSPYAATVETIGGTAPVSFALTAGTLPGGISFASDGTLAGTPTTEETQSFTITATDAGGIQAAQAFTLNVLAVNNVATVSFGAVATNFQEDTATLLVEVTLTSAAPTTDIITAEVFDTATGTASSASGGDFSYSTQSVSFPAGSLNGITQTVAVAINGETIEELDETIILALRNVTGPAQLGATSNHLITILNDDPSPTVELLLVTPTVDEGVGSVELTIQLSNPTVNAVNVPFTVAGTALGPNAPLFIDHRLADGDRDIAATVLQPGNTTATITVDIEDDLLDEDLETIIVTLGAPSGGSPTGNTPSLSTTSPTTQTITIVDNDDLPSLSVGDLSVDEANLTATFTVTLDPVSGREVNVDFATSDGTAIANPVAPATNIDYTPTDSLGQTGNVLPTLEFVRGTTTLTVSVPVTPDLLNEIDETFNLNISNPVNAVVGDATGVATIVDDDPVPTVEVQANTNPVDEGAGATTTDVTYAIILSAPSGRTVTLDVATNDGTALSAANAVPQDFLANSASLTFVEGGNIDPNVNGGQPTQTFTVTVNGDDVFEDDETFTVDLTNLAAVDPGIVQVTQTITNDEAVPQVFFGTAANAPQPIQGPGEGVGDVTVTLAIDPVSAFDVTIDVARDALTTAQQPVDVTDIDAPASFVRTYITSNNASPSLIARTGVAAIETQATTLPGNNEGAVLDTDGNLYQNGDVANQPSVRIFRDVSDRPDGAIFDSNVDDIIIGSNTGLVAPKGIDVDTAGGFLFVSDNGAQDLKVFATTAVDNASPLGTTPLGRAPWDLDYDPQADRLFVATTDGAVLVFDDYVASGFAPSGTPSRTIVPNDNNVQASVNLHGLVHNAALDQLYVSDVGAASANDDGQLFLIENASTADGATQVTRRITNVGGAAGLGNPVDVVFDGRDLIVAEKLNDLILTYANFATETAQGAVPPDASVSLPAGTKPESLALDAGGRRDHDFENVTVLIPALSPTATTRFRLLDDNRDESDETVVLNLSNPVSSQLTAILGVNQVTNPTVQTNTIGDDDAASVLSIDDVRITEPDNGSTATLSFTLLLDRAAGRRNIGATDLPQVDFATLDGQNSDPELNATELEDYQPTTGSRDYVEGSVFRTVEVTINGDLLNEKDEDFTLELSNGRSVTIGDPSGLATIENNDNPPTLTIEPVQGSVDEAAGTAQFRVLLANPGAGLTVTVQFDIDQGQSTASLSPTAINNVADFTPQNGATQTLTFVQPALGNQPVIEQIITIDIENDGINEADETIVATLSADPGGAPLNAVIGVGSATVTIEDNDPTQLTLTGNGAGEPEAGGAANLTASIDVVSEQTISFNFGTADGSAVADGAQNAGSLVGDYVTDNQTRTIAAGQTSLAISLQVTDDLTSEIDESFTAVASNATGNGVSIAVDTATLVIIDEDASELNVSSETASEGDGSVDFTVSLDVDGQAGSPRENGQTINFTVTTIDGNALAANDFGALSSASFQLAPGERTKTVTVQISSDEINEADQSFQVSVDDGQNVGALVGNLVTAGAPGTGTLTDDDPIAIFVTDVTDTEGNTPPNGKNFDFELQLRDPSGASPRTSERNIRLDVVTTDGTASSANDADFTARDNVGSAGIVFSGAGDDRTATAQSERTYQVTVTRGDVPEQDEDFTVDLSNPTRNDTGQFVAIAGTAADITIGDAQGLGTIIDDDDATVSFVATADVSEPTAFGARTTVTVTATLDGPKSQDILVPVRLDGANANGVSSTDRPGDASDVDVAGQTVVGVYVVSNPSGGPAGVTRFSAGGAGERQNSFDVGNNENAMLDADGNLYLNGDVSGSPSSVRIFRDAASRADNAAFDPNSDDIIVGSSTGLVNPKGVDVDTQRGLIFVSDNGASNVKVFRTSDVDDATPQGTTSLSEAPWDLDYDSVNDRLFVATTSGNVFVFDSYVSGGFGQSGPSRTITPSDNIGAQVSVNLHGIVHNLATNELLLSDIGLASSASDGQLFLIQNADTAAGNTQATVIIGGASTQLGNPVDIAFDGVNLYVAEKSNGAVLLYNNFRNSASGDVAPDASYSVSAPESVALDFGRRRDHDFVSANFSFTANTNQTSASFSFTVLGDLRDELDTETIELDLDLAAARLNGSPVVDTPTAQTINVLDQDAEPSLAIADISVVEGDTGVVTATFELRLDAASGRAVDLNVETADGTASAALGDYDALATTLVSFAEGQAFASVSVSVNGDLNNEVDETFTLVTSDGGNPNVNRPADPTATIVNDDALPTLSIADVSVVEGGDLVFTVTLNGATGQPGNVVADISVQSLTAAATTDFDPNATVQNAAGNTTQVVFRENDPATQTVTVSTVDDNQTQAINEADETLSVTLTNLVNADATGGDLVATGTIQDNDDLDISINGDTVTEADADETRGFAVATSIPTEQTITVTVTLSQTGAGDATEATVGADVSLLTPSVTLSPVGGAASTAVAQVNVVGDLIHEADQSYVVSLSQATTPTQSSSQITIAGTGAATGLIQDNDDLSISIADDSVTEGDSGGDQTRSFEVTTDRETERSVDIVVTVAGVDAELSATPPANLPNDIRDDSNQTVRLSPNPGNTSSASVPVTVIGDGINEATETYTVTLSGPAAAPASSSQLLLADAVGDGTITDNDPATFSVGDVTVTEGAVTATFTVTLDRPTEQSPSIGVDTADGQDANAQLNAVAGNDYVAISGGAVVFGLADQSEDVVVTLVEDDVAEQTETFTVNLTAPNGIPDITAADAVAVGTITDDDDARVNVEVDAATPSPRTEGDSLQVNVTLDGPRSETITASVTLGAGSSSQPRDFTDIDALTAIRRLYVSKNPSGGPAGTDAFTGAAASELQVSLTPGNNENVVLDTDGNLYQAGDVAGDPASVRIIANVSDRVDGATFDPNTDRIILGSNTGLVRPKGLDVDTDRGLIFVSDNAAGNLKVFLTTDFDNVSPQGTTALPSAPWDLDYDGTNDRLFVASTNGDVLVFDNYVADSFGQSGASRTITPGNGGVQISTNLHGIIYDTRNTSSTGDDQLYLSDIGLASSSSDGQLFRITNPATASGLTQVAAFVGAGTQGGTNVNAGLGNPVDLAFDGQNLIVAEKSQGAVRVFNNFNTGASGDFAASASFSVTAPESVAVDPGSRRDHDFTSATVTFAPGETSKPVTIAIQDDVRDEADVETLSVQLDAQSLTGPAIAGATTTVSVDLNDNDDPSEASIEGVTLSEGDAGQTSFRFLVRLDRAVGRSASIDFSTDLTSAPTGTLATATDLTEVANQTLTFAEGSIFAVAEVLVTGDLLDEDDEVFQVLLTQNAGNQNANIASGTATGTIVNDDGDPLIIIDDVTVTEGDGGGTTTATFTVNLVDGAGNPAPSGLQVMADVQLVLGTASANDVALASANTVSFLPGETSQTVVLDVTADAFNEADETYQVTLSNPMNAVVSDGIGEGLITDDDPTEVEITGRTVNEGDGSVDSFDVSLTVASEQTIQVTLTTADGSAVAPGDYAALTTTVTIAGNDPADQATLGTTAVAVAIVDDETSEIDESFTASLGATPTGNGVTTSQANATATTTITENDDAFLQISGGTVDESAQSPSIAFTVTLTTTAGGGATRENGQSITVDYANQDGEATAGGQSDYDGSLSPLTDTLTFAPGESTKTVTIAVIDDTINEATETFLLNLSNATGNGVSLGNAASATGSITDDDDLTLSVQPLSIIESDSGTTEILSFTLVRNGASEQEIQVNFATQDDATIVEQSARAGSDYTARTDTVTFAASPSNPSLINASAAIDVSILGDDVDEDAQGFDLVVTLANTPRGVTVATPTTRGTITDNDAAPVLSIASPATQTEGATDTSVDLVVTLQNRGERTVTVDFATADGAATAGGAADYDALSGTLTFAPLTPSGAGITVPDSPTQTQSFSIRADDIDEDTESFTVTISNPTNATLAQGQDVATVSVDDNAADLVEVSIADVQVTELDAGSDTPMSFVVTLSRPSERNIEVTLTTADLSPSPSARATVPTGSPLTADYDAVTTTLTFEATNLETTRTQEVTIKGDDINEPQETFTATLSALTIGGQAATGGDAITDATANGTINDNDNLIVTMADQQASEDDASLSTTANAGSVTFAVNLVLQRSPTTLAVSEQVVLLNFATGDEAEAAAQAPVLSATAGADYTAVTQQLLYTPITTVDPGTSTLSVTVDFLADVVNEANQRFAANLAFIGTPDNVEIDVRADGTNLRQTIATIADNDPLRVSLLTADNVVESAGAASFPVTFNTDTEQDFEVTVATSDRQDIEASASAGTQKASGASNTNADYSANTQVFRTNGVGAAQPATTNFPLAAPPVVAPPPAVVVNLAQVPTANFDVAILDDGIHEFDERFDVTVTVTNLNPGGLTFTPAAGNPASGIDARDTAPAAVPSNTTVGNIEDDDPVTFDIAEATGAGDNGADTSATDLDPSAGSLQLNENGGPDFDFTVTLSGTTDESVRVNISTLDQSATAGTDFDGNVQRNAATVTSLDFGAGAAANQDVLVSSIDDTVNELDETFLLLLSNSVQNARSETQTGVNINVGLSTGVIDDNDAVEVTVAPTTIDVSSGSVIQDFVVTLQGSGATTGTQQAVTVITNDVSATAGLFSFGPTQATAFNPGAPNNILDLTNAATQTFQITSDAANTGAYAISVTTDASNVTLPTQPAVNGGQIVAAASPVATADGTNATVTLSANNTLTDEPLFPTGTVTDGAPLNGGNLTLVQATEPRNADTFGIANSGGLTTNGVGAGGLVSFNGAEIGTITNFVQVGTNGGTNAALTVTFNTSGNATATAVQALLRAVTFTAQVDQNQTSNLMASIDDASGEAPATLTAVLNFQDPTVSIPQNLGPVAANTSVTVPVNFSSNASNIVAAVRIEITLDSDLNSPTNFVLNAALQTAGATLSQALSGSVLSVVITQGNPTPVAFPDGVLFSFDLDSGATTGVTKALSVTDVQLTDANGNAVTGGAVNGSVDVN